MVAPGRLAAHRAAHREADRTVRRRSGRRDRRDRRRDVAPDHRVQRAPGRLRGDRRRGRAALGRREPDRYPDALGAGREGLDRGAVGPVVAHADVPGRRLADPRCRQLRPVRRRHGRRCLPDRRTDGQQPGRHHRDRGRAGWPGHREQGFQRLRTRRAAGRGPVHRGDRAERRARRRPPVRPGGPLCREAAGESGRAAVGVHAVDGRPRYGQRPVARGASRAGEGGRRPAGQGAGRPAPGLAGAGRRAWPRRTTRRGCIS